MIGKWVPSDDDVPVYGAMLRCVVIFSGSSQLSNLLPKVFGQSNRIVVEAAKKVVRS